MIEGLFIALCLAVVFVSYMRYRKERAEMAVLMEVRALLRIWAEYWPDGTVREKLMNAIAKSKR